MTDIEQLSFELQRELAANDIDDRRNPVDPRTLRARHSRLAQFAKSAAHYFEACQDQTEDESIATRLQGLGGKESHFTFGAGVHGLVLDKPIAVVPETNSNGKRMARNESHKEYAAFKREADARGCVAILTTREHVEAQAIADSIRRHETAMRLLYDGTTLEQTIEFDFLERACRATPDARTKKRNVELKTTRSSDPKWFERDVWKFHYASQAAFYDTAMEETTGRGFDEHYVVAVEKTRPYPVTVFQLLPAVIEQGKKQVRLWFEQLLVCEAANRYPAYSNAIVPIDFVEDGWEVAA